MKRRAPCSGEIWEDFAASRLVAAGLRIVHRRYSCRLGEIDLIAIDRDTLVFAEVRYRADNRFGGAAASVTEHKRMRIVRAARHFLMSNPQYAEYPIRMDVIALSGERNTEAAPETRWIRGAFEAQ